MRLKDIQPVSPEDFVVFENGTAYSYFIDRGIARRNAQEVEDFPKFYTAEQMEAYARIERDYIFVIDGEISTKSYAKKRFTGIVAVDVYGDTYRVVNHVNKGKKWVLQKGEA
ncbi:hypothetical protein AALM99_07760 [Lactococcus muris]|uniref:Phage protein n=2 Tax=Lactococcus TaxID=1357 RepID=A0ABV4DA91_9LACT